MFVKSINVACIVQNEYVFLKISFMLTIFLEGNQTLLVGVTYHPPTSFTDFDEILCHLLEHISYHDSDFQIIFSGFI